MATIQRLRKTKIGHLNYACKAQVTLFRGKNLQFHLQMDMASREE